MQQAPAHKHLTSAGKMEKLPFSSPELLLQSEAQTTDEETFPPSRPRRAPARGGRVRRAGRADADADRSFAGARSAVEPPRRAQARARLHHGRRHAPPHEDALLG